MSRYRVQKQAFSNYAISKKSSPLLQTRPWTNPYQQKNDQLIGKPAYIANPPTTEEWMKDNVFLKVIETRQAQLQQQAIQAKLTVGEPGDKYEQEADAMASQVMSMPNTAVQKESEEQVQTKPLAQRVTPVIRLTAARNGRIQVQSNLESQLNSSKGSGNPLPNQVRSFMEPRFGADFSQVRVHTDSTAVQMNRDLGAQAFTHGSDIYYGEGKAPGQNELTAHELTHVVQQGGAKTLNQEVQTKPKPKTTNFNKEVRLFPDAQTLASKQIPEIREALTNKESTPLHQKIENYNLETPVQTKQLNTENLIQRQRLNISSVSPRIQGGWFDRIVQGSIEWAVKQALGERVISILERAGNAIIKIIQDPVGFLGNLVTAIRNGFTKFQDNIGTHLTNGLMGWLFGALSNSGLVLPSTFDAKGLLSVALQVLGLTYNNFRARLTRRLGDENVNRLEQSYDFLQKIASGGLTAASADIFQEVGDIQETILGGIKDWLINAVIKAAVTKLITMFNPVGGLIEAAKAIYNTVMFFIERMQQIAALVDSIFSSIGKIVAGDTDSASNYIEQAMARTIPVVISFFARLLGLGGISDRIKAVIQRIQAPINRALDKLEQKIADKARTLLDRNQRQNQPPQPGATTPVTAPAPQSQPPSSTTPQAPVSTSTPTTTAPASQSPSSPATTPTRTQTPPSQQGNSNQQNTPNNNTNQADHDRKVQAGLAQIDREETKYLKNGKISKEDAEKVAAKVKRENPIFKSIRVADGGKTWDYKYVASPEETKKGEEKIDFNGNDLTEDEKKTLSLHHGGSELVSKLESLRTARSSKYQNELAEAKTALDAIKRGQNVIFFSGSVAKSNGNIHFGTTEGIQILTEIDVFTQEEMIEVKGGDYSNKKKLSDRDMDQFTNHKRIFEGKIKLYLNGKEIPPPKKWIYQFTAKEIDQRLKDWLLEKGVTEVRTGK